MSNQYLTAKEAADMTGLSERTIRRYIASGRTPARKVAPNRFAISIEDLPNGPINRSEGVTQRGRDDTQLWTAIENLRQELHSAKARILALEAKLQQPTITTRSTIADSAQENRSDKDPYHSSLPKPARGLPPGLVSLNSFCADHRININTVKGAIKRGELSYHSGSWKVGSTKIEYALDENEQAAILERYG